MERWQREHLAEMAAEQMVRYSPWAATDEDRKIAERRDARLRRRGAPIATR